MSYKSVPQESPTRVSGKSAPQDFSTRVSREIDRQECPTRVADMSVLQECPTRVSYKSVPQDFSARVSCKSGRQEWPTRVSHKSVPQECPTRVSHKTFPPECPARVADKSGVQECPTRVSHKSGWQECLVRNARFGNFAMWLLEEVSLATQPKETKGGQIYVLKLCFPRPSISKPSKRRCPYIMLICACLLAEPCILFDMKQRCHHHSDHVSCINNHITKLLGMCGVRNMESRTLCEVHDLCRVRWPDWLRDRTSFKGLGLPDVFLGPKQRVCQKTKSMFMFVSFQPIP